MDQLETKHIELINKKIDFIRDSLVVIEIKTWFAVGFSLIALLVALMKG